MIRIKIEVPRDFLEDYIDSFDSKKKLFLEKLAEIGVSTADMEFRNAEWMYSGLYDPVRVGTEWIDDNTIAVAARGDKVMFIEFGTGIHYADGYGESFGYGPGTWGPHGNEDYWFYKDQGGQIGLGADARNKPGYIITHGNPPARAMYAAGRDMRARIAEIANEVFG